MPRPGHFRKLDAEIPDEGKALARALRGLMAVVGLSLRQTHEALERRNRGCDASASALSDLLNARIRRPKREVIRALYDLAEVAARTNDVSMPVTWGELEDLRLKACEPCGTFVRELPGIRVAGPPSAGGPATRARTVAHAADPVGHEADQKGRGCCRHPAARWHGGGPSRGGSRGGCV